MNSHEVNVIFVTSHILRLWNIPGPGPSSERAAYQIFFSFCIAYHSILFVFGSNQTNIICTYSHTHELLGAGFFLGIPQNLARQGTTWSMWGTSITEWIFRVNVYVVRPEQLLPSTTIFLDTLYNSTSYCTKVRTAHRIQKFASWLSSNSGNKSKGNLGFPTLDRLSEFGRQVWTWRRSICFSAEILTNPDHRFIWTRRAWLNWRVWIIQWATNSCWSTDLLENRQFFEIHMMALHDMCGRMPSDQLQVFFRVLTPKNHGSFSLCRFFCSQCKTVSAKNGLSILQLNFLIATIPSKWFQTTQRMRVFTTPPPWTQGIFHPRSIVQSHESWSTFHRSIARNSRKWEAVISLQFAYDPWGCPQNHPGAKRRMFCRCNLRF